jgi:hypothetical protein
MAVILFGDLLGFLIAFRGWGYFDSGSRLLGILVILLVSLVSVH